MVGWTPRSKSLEQLGPGAGVRRLTRSCTVLRGRAGARWPVEDGPRPGGCASRASRAAPAGAWAGRPRPPHAPGLLRSPSRPGSAALFVEHTKTGNPLVDSVAEHQPAYDEGLLPVPAPPVHVGAHRPVLVTFNFGDGPSFLVVYASRGVLLQPQDGPLDPPDGTDCGRVEWDCCRADCCLGIRQVWDDEVGVGDAATADGKGQNNWRSFLQEGQEVQEREEGEQLFWSGGPLGWLQRVFQLQGWQDRQEDGGSYPPRCAVLGLHQFKDYSWAISASLSNPTIILKGQLKNGEVVYVDDFREAYWWLRDNTPADARVMAWWDYGYQITGISNRTTMADGNTWNHEHIALLGKILTGEMEESYQIARHLADYVLVWGGGGGDDLAKSPHLARIAN